MTIRRTPFPSKKATLTRIRAYLPIVLSLLMLMPVLVRHAAAQDQVPATIAYQGYLTNADGDPANGSAGIVFSLYDDDADGARLWQETQQGVVFTDGVFSVHLGSVVSLDGVPFDRPLWLGVAVAGGAELRPRVPLEAVPYALSLRNLRVVPGTSQIAPSPNLIGGHVENTTSDDVNGATIGGGGVAGEPNVVTADFGTVGGGADNQSGNSATIGGGINNRATGDSATITGGLQNVASETLSTVGGGGNNRAEAVAATIAGGTSNTASGDRTTVGGGANNQATAQWATVGGGNGNGALAQSTVVAGGDNNVAEGSRATIGGGGFNAAQGVAATVPGGQGNWAHGYNSFAAGFNARTDHDGTFVWADYFSFSDPAFVSTAPRQFLIRARGGVGIGTNAPQGALHAQAPDDDTPDLVLGGTDGDDNGLITSDLTLPSSDLNFFSNGGVGFKLDSNSDENNAFFVITDGEENPVFVVGETGRAGASELVVTGPATVATLEAEDDLGDTDTPAEGGVYRDNVVYAWAHVLPDGTTTASYGCTVSKITGFGSYRVTFNRSLPNGASAVVTVQTLNDPVIATAVTNANQADVATKVFNGSAFVAADYGFYIQVVGRP